MKLIMVLPSSVSLYSLLSTSGSMRSAFSRYFRWYANLPASLLGLSFRTFIRSVYDCGPLSTRVISSCIRREEDAALRTLIPDFGRRFGIQYSPTTGYISI